MATKKSVRPTKKAVKKATKKLAMVSVMAANTGGIHPPPCLPGEVEFIDAATGRRMCRRVSAT
jgi:hypothetical protein